MDDAYIRRNAILCELGFLRYSDYLQSSLWIKIRKRVLKRDKNKCYVCKRTADQVHHFNYHKKTLLGELLEGVVSICKICHLLGEYDKNWVKRSLEQANKELLSWKKFYQKQNVRAKEYRSKAKESKNKKLESPQLKKKCATCGEKFFTRTSKIVHCRNCRKTAKREAKKIKRVAFSCLLCGKEFERKNGVKICSLCSTFTCQKCGRAFSSFGKNESHKLYCKKCRHELSRDFRRILDGKLLVINKNRNDLPSDHWSLRK